MQCTERQVRKEAMEAWAALYESISGKLDEIYSELIDIRLKMAENLGFSGYEEMVFLQNKRYTPMMLRCSVNRSSDMSFLSAALYLKNRRSGSA